MTLWPFGRKNQTTSLSPEVQRIFEKALRFLDDEIAQNNALPENFRQVLAESPSCDRIPNAFGEFGRTLTNPIPVNGPVGELVYLSRLETLDGSAIAFHRIGAFDKVDVFEVLSEDGRHWDVLYLSLYFARKSKQVPSGYRMMTDKARRALIRGTTLRVDDFPNGIYSAALECTKRLIGIPIGDSRLKAIEMRSDLIRPHKHVEALSQLEFTSQTIAPPDPRRPKSGDQSGQLYGAYKPQPPEVPKKPQPQEVSKQPTTNQQAERKTQTPNSPYDYTQAGNAFGRIFFEPDIWHEMSKLCEVELVAREMAYARVAIIRDAIRRLQPHSVATQMLAGVDQYVTSAFAKPEQAITATLAIRLYEQNVSPLSHLSDVIVRRLLNPGVTAVEIASLLGKVATEAEALLKLSSTMQKLGERPPADQQPSAARERSAANQKAERSAQNAPTVKDLLVARAAPWNRVAPIVIDTIVGAITDKGLLEAFVMHSMNTDLVARYEALGGDAAPTVLRAQISQILCETGNRAIAPLAKALAANEKDAAVRAISLAGDTFEAAIVLAKNQIAAYIGLATIYSLVGKTADAHKYARLGLSELEKTRQDPASQALSDSAIFPSDILDQMERQLRTLLANE
jgi:hypothetical protein